MSAPVEQLRSAAVYRRGFLPRSETFVRDHLLNLRRYSPTAITTYLQSDGLPVAGVPLVVAQDRRWSSRLRRRLPGRFHPEQFGSEESGLEVALEQIAPDVLHAHFGTDGAVAVGATRRSGLPTVITFHGFDATKYPEVLRRSPVGALLLDRWSEVVSGRAQIIAVSGFIRDELVRRGADASAVHVVPCGVDPDTFTWSEPNPAGNVLFVGRLVEKKGCADLIEALAAHPGLPPLDVVGDGPLRSDLETLARTRGVDVTFHGMQDSVAVRRMMAASSVVAMPSRRAGDGDTEGLPVSSLEAGASGRPVVGYAHSGIVDSVISGTTGDLVAEGDVAGLGRALIALLGDPQRLASYSSAARAHIEANFDIRRTTARIEDVYDEARTRGG